MNANELRELAEKLLNDCDAIKPAVAYLHACADALERGPVAWLYDFEFGGKLMHGLATEESEVTATPGCSNVTPLYPVAMPAPPAPPHECKTEDEKRAFAFGWWRAMEARKPEEVKMPEPMPDGAIQRIAADSKACDAFAYARVIESETMRRVKEANE